MQPAATRRRGSGDIKLRSGCIIMRHGDCGGVLKLRSAANASLCSGEPRSEKQNSYYNSARHAYLWSGVKVAEKENSAPHAYLHAQLCTTEKQNSAPGACIIMQRREGKLRSGRQCSSPVRAQRVRVQFINPGASCRDVVVIG